MVAPAEDAGVTCVSAFALTRCSACGCACVSRCPALFLSKDAVLSTFSVAKQTSVVVDSGYHSTTGGHDHPSLLNWGVTAGPTSNVRLGVPAGPGSTSLCY